jgi:hypothetical protein
MAATDIWEIDGKELKYQDGDYVRIDTSSNPEAASWLPFLSGYVRGFDASTVDGETTVAYTLYSIGNNPLHGVYEDRLVRAVGAYGIHHGRNMHDDGNACGLCGANLWTELPSETEK